jgi:Glycosyl hydrolase family 79 C-terminal beta domain
MGGGRDGRSTIVTTRLLVISFVLLVLSDATSAQQSVKVSVQLDSSASGPTIPDDYLGFSFEMQELLPDAQGKRKFEPANRALVDLFKQLGVRSLRVGGNTADRPTVPLPSNADVDSLFAFAKAADAKVIYTLRLRQNADPAEGAKRAKYIMDRYADRLVGFAIGNEPNVYAKEFKEYQAAVHTYIDAVTALSPGAKFCGPGSTPGKAAWSRDYANEFGPTGRIAVLTQHSYPGASARRVTDTPAARDKMLSTEWITGYQKMHDTFVPAAAKFKIPYRLEEANSFFHAGAKDVSDTQAAALWALDFAHWWAAHGCAGINFHTGDRVAANEETVPCHYATFWTSPGGYAVRPIGYAIKAFDLGGRGRVVPVKIAAENNFNLTAYAMQKGDELFVTLINKSQGTTGSSASVTVASSGSLRDAHVLRLSAADGSAAATSGITLGGATIDEDASWRGTWTGKPSDGGRIAIDVAAATAVVVKFRSN